MEGVQLGLGCAVGAEVGVGPGEVLAVVDGEVHVVQGMVGGAVEELFRPVARDHVAVVDQDGPDLDGDEEDHVQVALHWADEDEQAVRLLATGRVAGSGKGGTGQSHWYGSDWTYPSSGWKARAAHGVGTEISHQHVHEVNVKVSEWERHLLIHLW